MVKTNELPNLLARKTDHNMNTVVTVGQTKHGAHTVSFGAGELQIIAGPCTIESRDQMLETALAVKQAGATLLRGGAFKPRTSPYSFQGLGEEGLQYLSEAKRLTGLPTVSEILDPADLPIFHDVDLLQVGAKNMQNFSLLKALGQQEKPVLLKRGFGSTIEEFLYSAEYILSAGNPNVILCERGIRTFDKETRFALDLSVVPILRGRTHLPIIVDPSHAMGISALVPPMAKAAVIVGTHGLMLEVHDFPEDALCDGPQAISTQTFSNLVGELLQLAPFAHKPL